MSLNPFCCQKIIPTYFGHFAKLLPPDTTHHALAKQVSPGPLLATFLAFVISPNNFPLPVNNPSITFYVIIQIIKIIPTGFNTTTSTLDTRSEQPKYYVPFETFSGSTVLDQRQRIFAKRWREIDRYEAEGCIRQPGWQIAIGDGERWTRLDGMEKIWCETHGCWFECKVWVREV